jgi:4-oxalocrotonate tautomerase family enzyme
MPMMDLTYTAGALTPEARAALPDELTTILLRAERAPDTPFFRGIAWLFVHELPAHDVCRAGATSTEPLFRLNVTIPSGALSDRRKEEFVREATRVMCAAAGLDPADSLRVCIIIDEVTDGNWGAGGNVVRFEQLRQIAAEQARQAAQGDEPGQAGQQPAETVAGPA